jgi:hypothetical protein
MIVRFVAFPATEYDEVLSGYQPGQMVERWANQRFKDHLCPCPQGTSLTMNDTFTHIGQYIYDQNKYLRMCLFVLA